MMPFRGELFLAWKYLRPQKSLISLLTYLSLLGPMLGVAVLLVVMSVMNGMPAQFIEKLKTYNPHITIEGDKPFTDSDSMVAYIEDKYKLKVSPITSLKVFSQKDNNIQPFKAKGIYPPKNYKFTEITDGMNLIKGPLDLKDDEVLMSTSTAYQNFYRVGDEIVLHSPSKYKEALKSRENGQFKRMNMNAAKAFKIAGFYIVNEKRIDEQFMIIHQDTANEMLSYGWGTATSLEITLDDPDQSLKVIEQLKKDSKLSGYTFTPWQKQSKQIYERIKREKLQMSFVMLLIVGASGIGIGACIFSLVVQKVKEIGILKSCGTSPKSIVMIFMSQGAFIGITGSLIGYIAGLGILRYRMDISQMLAKMNINAGNIGSIPMHLEPSDIQFILWGSIGICLLASTIPAIIAASINPVKALQSGS